MKKTGTFLLGVIIGMLSCFGQVWGDESSAGMTRSIKTWAVYYAPDEPTDILRKFDLVVLDMNNKPDLVRTPGGRPIYLGYVSIGEAEEERAHFAGIKGAPFLVDKNPDWGSWYVDVRSEQWQRFLLDEVIPEIFKQGFDGLFLDTLDTAAHLEKYTDPEKYCGSMTAMASLVKQIRRKYPHAWLCANRGMDIWTRIADHVDGLVLEDYATIYDFKNNRYKLLPEKIIRDNMEIVREIKKTHPRVTCFALDYVKPGYGKRARRVIARARADGLVPYIGPIHLDTVYTYSLGR